MEITDQIIQAVFKEMSRRSVEKRFKNMGAKAISEYMKKVRKGRKVKK